MTASASLPTAGRRGDAGAPPAQGAKPAAKDGAQKTDSSEAKPADSRDRGKPDGGDKKSTAKPAPKRPPARPVRKLSARRRLQLALPPLAFATVVTAGLLYGWHNSDEGYLTPESGIGYALGIIGGSAMLVLLGYPLRKRLASLKIIGSVTGWFRLHMMLGVIGPALILLHANFKLGSLNSNVALFAMLIVAGSGLVGRYLYGRIHMGLYGRRAQISELQAEAESLKGAIEGTLSLPEALFAELDVHAKRAVGGQGSAAKSLLILIGLRLRSARLRQRLLMAAQAHIKVEGKRLGSSWLARRRHLGRVRRLLRQYFVAVNKTAAFAFYERVFALWHVLHLPLFAILVFAAVIHVVAVHLY
ncbi:MAG TPA: pyridine nucleotide-disulfide oxidoreductase [Hyphomicrobiaceae bacterium]|nr:pyridine nucleotide-disulfide oxidoreductase [Hyphomicrobiaceae bacterium]